MTGTLVVLVVKMNLIKIWLCDSQSIASGVPIVLYKDRNIIDESNERLCNFCSTYSADFIKLLRCNLSIKYAQCVKFCKLYSKYRYLWSLKKIYIACLHENKIWYLRRNESFVMCIIHVNTCMHSFVICGNWTNWMSIFRVNAIFF